MRLLAWNGRSFKLNTLVYRVPKSVKLRTYRASTLHARTGPWDSRSLRHTEFLDSQQLKVVRLSALRTGRLYLPAEIRGTVPSLLVYQHRVMFSHLKEGGLDMPGRSKICSLDRLFRPDI